MGTVEAVGVHSQATAGRQDTFHSHHRMPCPGRNDRQTCVQTLATLSPQEHGNPFTHSNIQLCIKNPQFVNACQQPNFNLQDQDKARHFYFQKR